MTKTPEEPKVPIKTETEELTISSKRHWFKRFIGTKKGKVLSIIALVVVIIAVLFAIPVTRYAIAGVVIKKEVNISVVDSTTNKPVTDADVMVGSVSGKTDSAGVAHLSSVPVGNYTVNVTKNYYETTQASYTVPILASPQQATMQLKATGRQVVVNVINSITKEPLAEVTLEAHETSAATDARGNATIVLPADQETVKGTLSLDGYNQAEVTIQVTEQEDANKLALTPSGSLFYLSKQTGKINVMKSNLDGSNPQVVVEGTGNENDHETVLLAARDWRYLALLASRSGDDKKELYLVDTISGELTLIDEGSNISFSLIGWSDHSFTYTLTRYDRSSWQNGYQVLKAYNAETRQLNTVDETRGQGDHPFFAQSELMVSPYILEGKLIYAKYWSIANGVSSPSDKKSSIVVVNMNNLQKQVIKEFAMNRAIQIATKLYEPQEVYFRVVVDEATPAFYEYEGSSIKTVTNTDDKFFSTSYPTYLVSPSGEKTFWSEPRDGRNALFVGDKNGDNSTELTLRSEYTAYGWFSDDYILLSKNGSELYIAPSGSLANEPVKISNYHKPQLNFSGYGYGYGGQ